MDRGRPDDSRRAHDDYSHPVRVRATWDSLPIADEPPFGATVVVFRVGEARPQVLLLHRAHQGPHYEGDWAWTPPAGARLPGESIEACACRELREETGLQLPLERTACGTDDWWLFLARAPHAVTVMLDLEHDRFEWVPCEVAAQRCLPDLAGRPLAAAARLILAKL